MEKKDKIKEYTRQYTECVTDLNYYTDESKRVDTVIRLKEEKFTSQVLGMGSFIGGVGILAVSGPLGLGASALVILETLAAASILTCALKVQKRDLTLSTKYPDLCYFKMNELHEKSVNIEAEIVHIKEMELELEIQIAMGLNEEETKAQDTAPTSTISDEVLNQYLEQEKQQITEQDYSKCLKM